MKLIESAPAAARTSIRVMPLKVDGKVAEMVWSVHEEIVRGRPGYAVTAHVGHQEPKPTPFIVIGPPD